MACQIDHPGLYAINGGGSFIAERRILYTGDRLLWLGTRLRPYIPIEHDVIYRPDGRVENPSICSVLMAHVEPSDRCRVTQKIDDGAQVAPDRNVKALIRAGQVLSNYTYVIAKGSFPPSAELQAQVSKAQRAWYNLLQRQLPVNKAPVRRKRK